MISHSKAMKHSKYLIMNIGDGNHSKYGKAVIIQANPVTNNGFMEFYSETINSETEMFFVPDDGSILNPIMNLARMRRPWTPNVDEFDTETIRNEHTGLNVKINVHRRLSGKTVPFEIEYTVREVSFDSSNFKDLEEDEKWTLTNESIETPYGHFDLEQVTFVDEGPLVGLQFGVFGYLRLSDICCYDGNDDGVFVSTIAIVRQPNNVWLWAYFMDSDGKNIATFCGNDELNNGLAEYVENFRKVFG